MEKLKELTDKIKNGWENLDKKKRKSLFILVFGIILVVSIATAVAKKVDYTMLYTDLTLEDSSKIVSDLESKNIKYKLENGGTSILIDSNKLDRYRLQLATDGNLPSEIAGYEIFDDVGMMVTDDDRKVMYQRALEGELEKSINTIDAVKDSKVHLVMSEKSIFETEQNDASASVVLNVKPNYNLTDDSLRGIGALVSGAVEKLPLKNIQIIDSQGNLLSNFDEGEDGGTQGLNKQHKMKHQYEKSLEGNVLKLLEPVLGKNKVNVAVNADLDFDAVESKKTTYENPVVRSENLNVNGTDIKTQPDDANIGYTSSNVINQVDGEDATFNRTVNNELDTEVTNTVKAPGSVKKLTVSVVFDGELSRQRTQEIENIIGTAIGYDGERNDLINVVGMEFDKADVEDEKEDAKEGFIGKLVGEKNRWIVFLVAGLLLLLILILIVRRIFKGANEEEKNMDFEDYKLVNEEADEESAIKESEAESLKINIDMNETKVKEYCQKEPEATADLIKAWMKEE